MVSFMNVPMTLFMAFLMSQKHTPDTTDDIKDEYDYIIVGAGSAGSALAARLSEKECVTVLLLEAGKSSSKLTDIPALSRTFVNTDIDWNYTTTPQVHTGAGLINRRVVWPSGKTIGGSSVINAMLNLRGNWQDYDEWAALGAEGWDYKNVLPYFKKLENNTSPEYVENGFHGTHGPVTVSKPDYRPKLKEAVIRYGREKGYHVGDINGPMQSGFYNYQGTLREGQRCSSAKAYLVPNEKRKNLHIVEEAFVKKILINNHGIAKAMGVDFDFQERGRHVRARREVILSAGTTNTAQLLMLSGIGPKEELEKHRIPLKAELPVGKNLQDHCAPFMLFELEGETPISQKLTLEAPEYFSSRKGYLSNPESISLLIFLDRLGKDGPLIRPEYELYFMESSVVTNLGIKPEYYPAVFGPAPAKAVGSCNAQLLHPKSRGTVTLRSRDPYDPPIIEPNYFSNPDDLEVVVAGLKKCKEIITSEPLRKIGAKLLSTPYPGCGDVFENDDKYFRCMARSIVITLNHQVGTATMGNPDDKNTVVDPKLRVHKIRKLRVVDASVMPRVPGGNTNVPTMMVAEKAADIIKEDIHCSSG